MMVSDDEQLVVNHGVLLSQWLIIIVNNDEPVIVNHGVLYHDSQPLAQHNTP
jgi:hypothetical protein